MIRAILIRHRSDMVRELKPYERGDSQSRLWIYEHRRFRPEFSPALFLRG